MPSETLQISIMKTVLTNIFGTINGMFVTEDKICSAYENEMGKLLEDDLRPLKMDLQEFIKRYFYEEFTIIPDPTQRSYMRRQDYLSQISARPAITAPTESNNGIPTGFDSAPTAPASQHNGSGRDHSASQSRQSSLHSTPTPPPASFQPAPTRPAVPLSSFQDAPPGFSQPRQEVVTQRNEKLQKQFSDLGLEGVFHPEVLKQHFGDLSELIPDELENQPLLFNNSSYINGANTNNNNSSLLNLDIQRDKRIDHQPKTVPNIEELETTPSPSHADEHLETDDFLDEGTHGIVESPHGSVCDESHEQSVPPKSNEDFGLSRQDFPPLNVKVEPKQKCVPPPPGFDGIKSALRDQLNESNRPERPVEGSRKVHVKTEIPFEVSLEDPRFPASFKKHLSPFKCELQISQTKLFYNIVQGSITNSMDVNGYRDSYQKHLEDTDVYQPVDEKFLWLTGQHLSVNPNTEGYMPNNAFLIDVLQLYARNYPEGMSTRDLILLEENLCSVGQPVCLGRSTEIMSVSEMIEREMIVLKNQRYHVHDYIKSIKLLKLPPGITSNLYRILNAQQVTMVQDVSNYTGILNNIGGDPVMVQDEDIIRQTNIFPLVFKVSAQAAEQQNVRTAQIRLHEKLPRWRVLLDQPNANRGEVKIHCDCHECFKDQSAIIVPSQD